MSTSKVIPLARRRPEQALEALNRVTGLTWTGLPRSLLPEVAAMGNPGAHRAPARTGLSGTG